MNKNILFIALVAVMAAASVFLLYGIITHKAPAAQAVAGPSEAAVRAAPAAGESEQDYLSAAAEAEKNGDHVKAKESYQKMLEKYPGSANVSKAQESLDSINVKILFSPVITADSFKYEVQKGDTLSKISKRFNTTAELIMKANSLKSPALRIGQKLKITKIRFSIAVDKTQNILTLKADQDIFKTYRVSTGKNSCTPVGTFTVTNKIVDPPWYPSAGGMIPSGDPKNVLGSRWLGISRPSYGIHGTIDPDSIGKSVTEGCVRLKNSDVEELYAMVPIGTEVVIVD